MHAKKSLHNQISEQNYRGVDYSFQNLIEMYNNLRFKAWIHFGSSFFPNIV